jgi:hypothetical protein
LFALQKRQVGAQYSSSSTSSNTMKIIVQRKKQRLVFATPTLVTGAGDFCIKHQNT